MKLGNLVFAINNDFTATPLLLRNNHAVAGVINNNVFFNQTVKEDNSALVASNQISSKPLHCYHYQYQILGGKKLSKDVVNMVIQQIVIPKQHYLGKNKKYRLFYDITQQVRTSNITSPKEIWFLTSIITQCEFGFSINYSHWLMQRIFNNVFKNNFM